MGKGIDKFLNILSLSSTDDDDDYGIDDDLFDNEVDLVQEPPRRQKKEKPAPVSQTAATVSSGSGKSGIFSSYKNDDDDEYDQVSYTKKPKVVRQPKAGTGTSSKIVSMNSRGSKVYVIRPKEFNEAQDITDFLNEGKTIVINMEGIDLTLAQRIIDFVGGACYALDGSLQAISNNIFIAAPHDIEVTGDLREEILNESTVSPNLSTF